MDDPSTFCLANRVPLNDDVILLRGKLCSPTLHHRHLGDFAWVAAWVVLGGQFIKWAVVLPIEHLLAGKLVDDLETTLLLKYLLERLQLRHAFDPFLALELVFLAVRREGPL